MDVKTLPENEKNIYQVCMDGSYSIYDIIGTLSEIGINISYPSCCQKCGILVAKKLLAKKVSGRKTFFTSIMPVEVKQ